MRGNECREEKKQRAQAMLKSDAKAKTEGRDASQPSDSLLPRVSMESEDCHSERVTSNSMSKASTADGVETRATTDRGSQVIEPGAHRVATGRSTSSSEIRDEEGDPAPPSLSPPQPDGSQAPPQQRLSQNVRVDAEQSTMDLAPLILEAVVVTEATRQVATTRNSATKPVLVEGRPETPNRRRVWLILLGLLTLGVAVGISVGITENRPKESASQSANDVAPTAPPTLAPTTVAILEDFLSSLPDPTRNMIDAYPSSPQAKAFAWLSRPQHPRYESREMWRFMQRFALATLYYSTEGDLWRKNAGWLNETVSECEWWVS